ncbi:hypothetical protein RD1_2456 [Roseobacter denitrificans OCh 114]|uniref:Uncharacterized protein n=1 Tax=Roseobacter denitrificans (strain ATCC 33942 / OCh 114) TaxID=375451 RepID=Q166S1_ROSDO|nr:hypothetical protein RD1_2456 [Roseobacter denitrificans OCh 114]
MSEDTNKSDSMMAISTWFFIPALQMCRALIQRLEEARIKL